MLFPALSRGSLSALNLTNNASRIIAGADQPFGHVDGPLLEARYGFIRSIAVDLTGEKIYVADVGNQSVRQIHRATGQTRSLLGEGFSPRAVTVAPSGRVAATDFNGGRVGVYEPSDESYLTWTAQLNTPWGLAFASEDVLWVAEHAPARIVSVTLNGIITALAGGGGQGGADGPALDATFRGPAGISLEGERLLIADELAHALRYASPSGALTTLVGGQSLAGGLPPGVDFELAQGAVGHIQSIVRVGEEILVAADAQILSVYPGSEDRW